MRSGFANCSTTRGTSTESSTAGNSVEGVGLVSSRMSSLVLHSSPKLPPPGVELYAEDPNHPNHHDINEGDIEEFAKLIGIDWDKEPQFRYLATEGLLAPLPAGWQPCKDLIKKQFYYFNMTTLTSQWEHPLNSVYREKVATARQEHAMSLMEQTSSSRPPPPRSLPPLKKLGMSRPPSSGLGLGRGGISSVGGGQRLDDHLTLNRVTTSLGELRGQLEQYDRNESDLPLPSSRTVKKPTSNLLLTGEGANFLKPKTSNGEPFNSIVVPNSTGDKSKSTVEVHVENTPAMSLLVTGETTIPAKSILTQKSNIRKGLINVIDSEEWMLKPEVMTDEEKKLLSELKIPLKDKHAVKFSIDEVTEITFDPLESEDASETHNNHLDASAYGHSNVIGNKAKVSPATSSEESEEEDSEDESAEHSGLPSTPLGKDEKLYPSKVDGAGEKASQLMSDTDVNEKKATLRQKMEYELRKYQESLEKERKEREAQINKHTEMTLEEFRNEKDSSIKKARQDFENQKNIELDKVKRELELMVKVEVDKLKEIFNTELEQQKADSRKQHNVAMSILSQEFDMLDDDQKAAVFQKTLSESTLKLNSELKEHKDNLREEQRKQIQQMRDYHKTFIEKLKNDLHAEEIRIQAEHKKKLAEIEKTLQQETHDMLQKLKMEQNAKLKTIVAEFDKEKDTAENELKSGISSLRNDFNNLKSAVNTAKNEVSTSSPIKSVISVPQQQAIKPQATTPTNSDEVKVLGEKYDQLEKKYAYLKKELRKITEAAASRHAVKSTKNISRAKNDTNKIKQGGGRTSGRNSESDNMHNDTVSITESESTTAYPSSYNNNNEGSLERTSSPVDELIVGNNDKLGSALKSLETLKQQILEIQNSRPSSAIVVTNPETSSIPKSGNRNKPPVINPPVIPITKRNKPTMNNNNAAINSNSKGFPQQHPSQNQKRTGVGNSSRNNQNPRSIQNNYNSLQKLRPSKSTPELPGLLEATDDSDADSTSPHQIVLDAKEFIRSQQERLNLPAPERKSIPNDYVASVSSRPKMSGEGHLFSETESSGFGSMSFVPGADHLKSTEKKKISRDIEVICSSLSHLDEQMKLMWNVVNTNSTTPNSSRFKELLHQHQPYPGLTSSRSNNEQLKAYLLQSSASPTAHGTPSNVLNTLDKELKEFRATKERILNQFSNPNKIKNNPSPDQEVDYLGSGGDQCLQDKTKDLREWLEKF